MLEFIMGLAWFFLKSLQLLHFCCHWSFSLVTFYVIILVLLSGLVSLATCQSRPKYSQQNMPQTSFTCRDKILGGYYADAETNCQMFHICVKVAGVGVSWKCHDIEMNQSESCLNIKADSLSMSPRPFAIVTREMPSCLRSFKCISDPRLQIPVSQRHSFRSGSANMRRLGWRWLWSRHALLWKRQFWPLSNWIELWKQKVKIRWGRWICFPSAARWNKFEYFSIENVGSRT